MKVVILDITGRNPVQYNPSLCSSLANIKGVNVTLLAPKLKAIPNGYKFNKLLKLVPDSIISSESFGKRFLRFIEVVLNYLYIIIYLFFKKPNILHIQWLPLLEFIEGESFILAAIKCLFPKMKILLTVHNVYPHNMSDKCMIKYHERFLPIDKNIDGYLVHLYSSKKDLISSFGIERNKIYVTYHGIYVAENYIPKVDVNCNGIKKIIMFGYQNYYKGTDVLIEALKLLPISYIKKLQVKIVGKSDPSLYEKYECEREKLNVVWINRFVSDDELYEYIGNSDLILLPYRKISQSGVLLLALSYKKPILTSNLPSFKETLEGYPEEYFFEIDNPNSLEKMLEKYLDGNIDEKKLKNIIEKLNSKYSWSESAKSTYNAYISTIKGHNEHA